MCAGKRRFKTELAAKIALMNVRRKGDDSKREAIPVRMYHCPQCRGWHLTSQEKH